MTDKAKSIEEVLSALDKFLKSDDCNNTRDLQAYNTPMGVHINIRLENKGEVNIITAYGETLTDALMNIDLGELES